MSEQQPPNPTEFSTFADWCLHKDSLSPAARYTVEVLLKRAGTSDIYEANRILLSSNKLDLRRSQISDITRLQSLTHLTDLYLSGNKISDITEKRAGSPGLTTRGGTRLRFQPPSIFLGLVLGQHILILNQPQYATINQGGKQNVWMPAKFN